jgi:hypothetical protein
MEVGCLLNDAEAQLYRHRIVKRYAVKEAACFYSSF